MCSGSPSGEHDDKLVGYTYGVEHLVLGISGVDVASLECHLGHGGVEILIFQLADGSTVHGVGPVGTKQVDVKLVCALAYLLVWIEGYAYVAVLDFGVLLKILYRRDDFGYAGFVVSSEQSVSVGHNEVLALVVEQFGKLGGESMMPSAWLSVMSLPS